MCGGDVHIILLFPLVARCLEDNRCIYIYIYIWRMLVCMSVVVIVCSCMGSVSILSCRYLHSVVFAFFGNYQCCVLHDLQFFNAGRGCKRRPYETVIL